MRVIVYLPDRTQVVYEDVTRDTTIQDILHRTNVSREDIVVFTGKPDELENQTPITKYHLSLEAYNLWFNTPHYSAELSIYFRENTESYNSERYNMYTKMW